MSVSGRAMGPTARRLKKGQLQGTFLPADQMRYWNLREELILVYGTRGWAGCKERKRKERR